ncbi:MAG: hypothetical protein C0617_13415 [Desulfuromonas sp.]|uniref:DUF3108 domain-containing protein n=1 Tax=Desulfuromonas sp. TaxID=892 RepID=UPI000CBA4FC1|nr:DUF3108 domain-containing protein [Desulfuromonas sp.]PLX82863.1 MAG: hypothetical protein C0617_13415 [Desulfuromonas sp.]
MTFSILTRCLVLLFAALLLAAPAAAETQPAEIPQGPASLESLVGESLSYDIAFLWFDRLAKGRLSFSAAEEPNTYRAVLEARTLGVAAWLTRDQVQRYVSLMELTPEGRLRPLVYESHVIKKKKKKRIDRVKKYTFDYEGQEIGYQQFRKGKLAKEKTFPLPDDKDVQYILTAFFNFRIGVYGPVEAGGRYVIPTMRRQEVSEIVIEMLRPELWRDHRFFPRGGLLGQVTVDPEVFDTGGGSVFVWFDAKGRPARGIVENIIGLGDVRGKLRR